MARAKAGTSRRSKAKGSVKVNFKDVESRQTPPEGDYLLKVLEAESDQGPSGDMIVFTLEIAKGKFKGQKVWFYCPLQENSLWKLHAFLTALGLEVPEDEMDIDLSELVDLEVMGVLTHETYQGKKRAKMTDFDSVENYKGGDEDEDDDEDDGKKSKSKSKRGSSKKSKDEDDEDEEDTKSKSKSKGKKKAEPEEPDYDDLDEDELRELYLERELGTKKEAKGLDEDELKEALQEADEAAAKAAKKGSKSKSKKDDDEEDDEPKGKSKGKAAAKGKKKPKKYDKDEVEEMDEDELQELIDESGIDVDLDDYKNLKKKVAAVVDALEEEDLLDD